MNNYKRAVVNGVTSTEVLDAPNGKKIGTLQNGAVVKIVKAGKYDKVLWGDYVDKTGFIKHDDLCGVNERSSIRAKVNGLCVYGC